MWKPAPAGLHAVKQEDGRGEAGSIDDRSGQDHDPAVLLNVGITLINQGKAAEALTYLDQAVTIPRSRRRLLPRRCEPLQPPEECRGEG